MLIQTYSQECILDGIVVFSTATWPLLLLTNTKTLAAQQHPFHVRWDSVKFKAEADAAAAPWSALPLCQGKILSSKQAKELLLWDLIDVPDVEGARGQGGPSISPLHGGSKTWCWCRRGAGQMGWWALAAGEPRPDTGAVVPAAFPCSPSRSSWSSYSRTSNPQIINSAEKVTASGSHENLLSRGYLKLFLIFLDPCFLPSSNASYFKKKIFFFLPWKHQRSNFPYLLAVSLCRHNLSLTACTEILMALCYSITMTFFFF